MLCKKYMASQSCSEWSCLNVIDKVRRSLWLSTYVAFSCLVVVFFKFLASCRSNLLLVEKVSKIYFKSFFMTFGRFCWRFLLVAKQRLGSFLVFSWIFRQNLLTLPINCCLLQFLPHQQSHKSRL